MPDHASVFSAAGAEVLSFARRLARDTSLWATSGTWYRTWPYKTGHERPLGRAPESRHGGHMPTKTRDQSKGTHHAWVNATGNWVYYVDEVDRLAWIRRLVQVLARYDWTCLAFCQMTTHVHLLVTVPAGSLAIGMRDLNLEYSKDFNARHGRVGSFIRKRYGSRRTEGGTDLLGTYAYVVLNPVREGMCPRAEDWRWSSYATTLGISNDFPFVDASTVLDELDGSPAALRDFVASRHEAGTRRKGHVGYQVPDVPRGAIAE